MFLVSVPNYSIQKFNDNYYSVALTNGNIGAGIIPKEKLDDFIKEHNGKDYRKPAKKIAIGLAVAGAITAGVLFRKPIAKVAKQVFEKVKNSKIYKSVSDYVKSFSEKVVNFFKENASKVSKKVNKK